MNRRLMRLASIALTTALPQVMSVRSAKTGVRAERVKPQRHHRWGFTIDCDR